MSMTKPLIIALDFPMPFGIQVQLKIGSGHGGLFLPRGEGETGLATPEAGKVADGH